MIYPIFASICVSLISLAGAFFLVSRKKTFQNLENLTGFAAGVMLTLGILDLLPEAFEADVSGFAPYAILISIVIFFFLERTAIWYHHHHNSHLPHPTVFMVLFGDGIHNFLDGLAIAAAFSVSVPTGVVTTLAIAAHELPSEFADFVVLLKKGLAPSKALLFNFISGLACILGVVFGNLLISKVAGSEAILLALAAGTFLYIPLSDLIPELHADAAKTKNKSGMFFVFGILVIVILLTFVSE